MWTSFICPELVMDKKQVGEEVMVGSRDWEYLGWNEV